MWTHTTRRGKKFRSKRKTPTITIQRPLCCLREHRVPPLRIALRCADGNAAVGMTVGGKYSLIYVPVSRKIGDWGGEIGTAVPVSVVELVSGAATTASNVVPVNPVADTVRVRPFR